MLAPAITAKDGTASAAAGGRSHVKGGHDRANLQQRRTPADEHQRSARRPQQSQNAQRRFYAARDRAFQWRLSRRRPDDRPSHLSCSPPIQCTIGALDRENSPAERWHPPHGKELRSAPIGPGQGQKIDESGVLRILFLQPSRCGSHAPAPPTASASWPHSALSCATTPPAPSAGTTPRVDRPFHWHAQATSHRHQRVRSRSARQGGVSTRRPAYALAAASARPHRSCERSDSQPPAQTEPAARGHLPPARGPRPRPACGRLRRRTAPARSAPTRDVGVGGAPHGKAW